MEMQNQDFQEDAQRRLEERPRVTLRLRIALVFIICALFMGGLTIGSIVMLSRFEIKMHFLEAVDECAFEIQEARRYEKNFFLYGTGLYEATEHIYRAHRLLDANMSNVQEVVGSDMARNWLSNLLRYEQLLELLAGSTNKSPTDDVARQEAEAQLRRYGAAILEDASEMSRKEKQSMNTMVRTAMFGAGASLVFMVLLMIVLADQLARQVIRPVGRFIRYVGRIAEGDLSPIRPARPYKDEFSTLAIAINRMLDELKSRQDQLLQTRKMAAVGTLTSGVAHELNNPLNNISLTVETLLDDYEETDDERKKKLLKDIFTQVQRAGATVRNLLDFTRKDQLVFTIVSVPEVVESTLNLVGNELSLANVNASLHVAEGLPTVYGNPRNLQQVFLNLFLNAMQAMPRGGNLEIRADLDGDFVRIAVQDHGTGIAEEEQEKIFEPFFTTKEAGEGTGLGLSVSYSIIEKHKGRIEVQSELGEGTTFSVYLPVRDECT
jgi:two-component system NtrC family sensor kinase